MSIFDPKTATHKQLGEHFIIQIANRNRIVLSPFDKAHWFSGSYSTIQRTLRNGFSPLTDKQKTNCAKLLFCNIPALRVGEFDKKLRDLVEQVAHDYCLSKGHAQKLVSILCKYAVAVHFAKLVDLPCDWQNLVSTHAERLPVPIDTIVLFSLKEKYPYDFKDVNAGRTLDNKKKRYIYYATIGKTSCCRGVAWSRLTDYDSYWSLQTRIRGLAKAEKLSPLEFEMRHLWVTE